MYVTIHTCGFRSLNHPRFRSPSFKSGAEWGEKRFLVHNDFRQRLVKRTDRLVVSLVKLADLLYAFIYFGIGRDYAASDIAHWWVVAGIIQPGILLLMRIGQGSLGR